ncbi:MAG: ankyrin repeat domain-containing protein [Phycisphaeraceae bacterium]
MDAGRMLSSDLTVIASCLKDGADPNAFVAGDADDVRALAVHAFEGRIEIVRLLLESGANPNLGRESTGETPLHHAVCGTIEIEVVQALLQAGGDPNAMCRKGIPSDNFMRDVRVRGETPLHRAAAYAGKPVIQALLDAGASVEIQDANGDSALSWASLHRRDRDILKLLCFGNHHV